MFLGVVLVVVVFEVGYLDVYWGVGIVVVVVGVVGKDVVVVEVGFD